VAHAHREFARAFAEESARAPRVAQLAQAPEEGAHAPDLVEERRERHQPRAAQAPAGVERLGHGRQLLLARAALGRLAREVYLHEHVEARARLLFAEAFETPDEFGRVNRVDEVEEFDGAARLVRLEVADEMPAHARPRGGQRLDLPLGLLHAVLAEVRGAGRGRGPDERGRVRLADGDERDLFRATPGPARGPGDASPQAFESRA
jgi:hypothetical protein